MSKSVLVVVLMLIFSFSINGMQEANKAANNRYFPQHLGDEHVYRKTGRTVPPDAPTWGDKIINQDKQLFQHSNYWNDGVVRWLRANKKANVIERQANKRALWYMFSSPLEKEWMINLLAEGVPCVDNARAKIVSFNETVTVPAGTFQDCAKIVFSSNCNDAGVTEQWFAPKVGLVKQTETSFAGPIVSELISAQVGGITYPQK